MQETTGDRLFLIRAACGNGTRDPESLKEFRKRVLEKTGRDYDPTTISLLERMKQKWRIEDVRTFASVDPLGRGEVWLSALDGARDPDAVDTRPSYVRIAEQHGLEVATAELPGKKTAPAKKVANAGRSKRKR